VLCPWMRACAGREAGIAAELPRKAARRQRPVRHGVHFLLTDDAGRVLLRRRPAEGLLGGMTELPGTPWRGERWAAGEAMAHAPMRLAWRSAGQVRHGFTHFELVIDLFAARAPNIEAEGFLCPITTLDQEALPSLMRKCVRMAGNGLR
jgi:A/G-specific adenine glycosylase